MSGVSNWFTSDLHVDHKNIIQYCNRPWTFEQQREEIVHRWNSRVGMFDKVYHLGDFVFAGSKATDKVIELIKDLNGEIHFMEGKKYELDKDIKGKGDKWYSPGNCAFVPQHLNKLLNDQKSRVGDLPLGVSFHKKSGKYSAKISSFNRRVWLGLYDTPEEASIEYKSAKSLEILRLLRYYEDHLDSEVVFELYRRVVNNQ